MAKLFIQDTTLTAIADAIRSKTGGASEPATIIIHAPNTYGFSESDYDSTKTVWDSSEGIGVIFNGSNFTAYRNTYEIQVPGAAKFVVKVSAFLNAPSNLSKTLEIRKNWYSEGNGSLIKGIYSGVSEATYEITGSDKMSVYLQLTNNNEYSGYGFYAEITPYDSDGNVLMSEGGNTSTYTPLEMPNAILGITGGGGITPTGEIEIVENGDFDVTEYANAHVEVPVGVFPSGDLAISANGVYDIENYETVTVLVASGGSDDIEPLVLTGDQNGGCTGAVAAYLIENYPDKIITSEISAAYNMFKESTVKNIPFDINFVWTNSLYWTVYAMFYNCYYLEKMPKMVYLRPGQCYQMFYNCQNLRDVSGIEDWDCSYMNNGYPRIRQLFYGCKSLRAVPEAFLKKFYNWDTSATNVHTNQMFYDCNNLDEIVGLNFHPEAEWTSNAFIQTFDYCYCLKRLVFATNEDGTAKTAKWTNQTIDLSSNVGYHYNGNNTDYDYISKRLFNSGRTTDKLIYNDATYQALKDDPDAFVIGNSWYPNIWYYSRYDKASALETIASLPDCSAYGGSNTIKFKSDAGTNTDAGAINTMTEEEIAVAAAKGWTVTFV